MNLQEIGNALESELKKTREDYFSTAVNGSNYGVKKTDGSIHVVCRRENSVSPLVLRKVNGKWRLFKNPFSSLDTGILEGVYQSLRKPRLVGAE